MKKLLRIYLFGSPHILYGDEPVNTFPTEKVKLLFYYLILFRQTAHARSMLWGLFWGESSEAQARRSFSTALWRLQRWLQPFQTGDTPFLLVDDRQVAFNRASAFWLDTAEFEQRSERRRMNAVNPALTAAVLNHALELYQGELLEGYYADWCLAERDRLHKLYLQSLVHLMIYHGGRGNYTEAIDFAQHILQDDPLREDVQRELMKLFTLNQQPAEALQQYRRCEAVLHEELGIEPMPETQEVFRLLMLGSAVAAPIPNPTPATAPGDVGHHLKQLLHKIDAALENFEGLRAELVQTIELLEPHVMT